MKKAMIILISILLIFISCASWEVTASSDAIPPEWQNQGQDKTEIRSVDEISLYSQGKDDIALDWAYLATDETGEWRPWWNNNWEYRIPIIIDHNQVDADLTNFPVLVHHTSSDFINHAQPDGDDFVFIDTTHSIQYNHEIEYYNSVTGELIAWVNIPLLYSSENTLFYVYFGNPTCAGQEHPAAVWNSDFLMVHHMTGDTYSDLDDSTSNGWDVTSSSGSPSYNQDGKVGRCVDFDGSGDYLKAAGDLLQTDESYTASAWVSARADLGYIFSGDFVSNPVIRVYSGNYRCYVDAAGGIVASDSITAHNGWQYVTTRVDADADQLDIFVNGISEDNDLFTGTVNQENTGLNIGTNKDNNNYYFDGWIDEIWISDIARSSYWIKTEYNSMSSPSTFLTFADEQYVNDVEPYGTPLKMQENDQWQWSNFVWKNPSIIAGTTVNWKIYYSDTNSNIGETEIMSFTIVPNNPPDQPEQPDGPNTGYVGVEYTYNTNSVTDPDDDDVKYLFNWGDGTDSGWIDIPTASHTWTEEGVFSLKTKAKDNLGEESDWSSTLTVTVTVPPLPILTIDSPSSIDEGSSFHVTVTADNVPIENVKIEFREETYYTGTDGVVNLLAPLVEQNTDYTISAIKDEYESTNSTITVLNKEEQVTDKGWIFGRVSDALGVEIEDASVCVVISDTGAISSCTFTDERGRYNILVPTGTRTLRVSKQGYEQVTKTGILVIKNQATGEDFELEEIVEYEPVIPSDENTDIIEAAIGAGISAKKVGGEINFEPAEETYNVTLYKEEIDIEIISINTSEISFTIGAEDIPGTIIAIRLFGQENLSDIKVEYDNETIEQVGFVEIFNLADRGDKAVYTKILADSEDGSVMYCLLYIPNFSKHDITIYTIEEIIKEIGGIAAITAYIVVCIMIGIVILSPMLTNIIRRRMFFRKNK